MSDAYFQQNMFVRFYKTKESSCLKFVKPENLFIHLRKTIQFLSSGIFDSSGEGYQESMNQCKIDLFNRMSQVSKSLTAKGIVHVLSLEGNEELKDFGQGFYRRIGETNKESQTNQRTDEEKVWEAFSRIIVGDEVCSAFAIDSGKLLISANQNSHSKDWMTSQIYLFLKRITPGQDEFECQTRTDIAFNDEKVAEVMGEKHKASYNRETKVLKFETTEDMIRERIKIKDNEWLIADWRPKDPDIHFSLNKESAPGDFNLDPPKDQYCFLIKEPKDLKLDSFRRRIEAILQFLSNVNFLACKNRLDELKHFNSQQENILINSFAWDAASKYFAQSKSQDVKEFRNAINDVIIKLFNFCPQNVEKKSNTTDDFFVQAESILKDNDLPNFKKYKKLFIQKAFDYFRDLDFLKSYIIAHAQTETFLIKLLSLVRPSVAPTSDIESCYQIIEDLQDGAHAEMRLLWYAIQNKRKLDFIATTLLCCAHCHLAIERFGIKTSGHHAKAYPGWKISPEWLKENIDAKFFKKSFKRSRISFLEVFLGKRLYSQYKRLENLKMPSYNGISNQGLFAKLLIEEIGTLDEPHLKKLDIIEKRIWSENSPFPNDLQRAIIKPSLLEDNNLEACNQIEDDQNKDQEKKKAKKKK